MFMRQRQRERKKKASSRVLGIGQLKKLQDAAKFDTGVGAGSHTEFFLDGHGPLPHKYR